MKFAMSLISLFALGVDAEVTISFEGTCNYDALVTAAAEDDISEDTIVEYLTDFGQSGVLSKGLAKQNLKDLCDDAIALNSDPSGRGGAYDFKKINDEGHEFDNNYFDGGTYLNGEYEREKVGSGFDEVYDNVAQTQLITFPEDTVEKNFDNCKAQSVMCCWVQDRQDDNDGNCEEDDCKNADPADNTNVCYQDLAKGKRSSHVKGGYAVFSRTEDEGAAHCHGFAWDANKKSTDYRYRGNLLFYVSMYDHLSTRGYVREIPGAPMCGCVEKMPVVEESDCTEFKSVTETYTFTFKPGRKSRFARITDVDIEYEACTNNELEDRFAEITDKTNRAQEIFSQHIVGQGNCDAEFDTWLREEVGYKYVGR